MDSLTGSDLRELLGQSGICVSICMPTHRVGAETLQDPIRLKNLLRAARSQLRGLGLDAAMVDKVLTPAVALLDDHDFWQHQGDGLAVYCSPGFHRLFRVPLALPELAVVAARFHSKPLLTLLASNALLSAGEDASPQQAEAAVLAEVDGLLAACRASDAIWIMVSNEVGLGLVPPYPLGRLYRDVLGRANQRIAAAADRVLFMVAGLPLQVK